MFAWVYIYLGNRVLLSLKSHTFIIAAKYPIIRLVLYAWWDVDIRACLCCLPLYCFLERVSLNLELTESVRLTGQQALEILLLCLLVIKDMCHHASQTLRVGELTEGSVPPSVSSQCWVRKPREALYSPELPHAVVWFPLPFFHVCRKTCAHCYPWKICSFVNVCRISVGQMSWVALLREDVSTLARDAKPCSFTHSASQDISSQEGSEETRFLRDHIGSPTTRPHSNMQREYSAN